MTAPLRENIDETTVGDLAGVRAPMGSMVLYGTYLLPDGSSAEGVTATLVLGGRPVVVGLGSEVAVTTGTWRVVDIAKSAGEPGSVTLELVS